MSRLVAAPASEPTTLPLAWIRPQFPALDQTINGNPVAFLDGPGGTQVPQRVIDAVGHYLAHDNANAHGAFANSQRTDHVIAAAHGAMADFLGCDSKEIIFGPNMTSLTFAMSRAIGRQLRPGDEILVTCLDHDANVAPWLALGERGMIVHTIDMHPQDCTLDLDDLTSKLSRRTRLLAITYASNAVGTLNDLPAIIRLAHDAGAWVYVDAVHYAPHGPIDVHQLDCDFLVCSPYKFFGPHIGVLYGKQEHLEQIFPYKVRPASEAIPDRWETGTQNHEGLAGVTAAVDYLADLGQIVSPQVSHRRKAILAAMTAIHHHGGQLCQSLIKGLLQLPEITIYGITASEQMGWRLPTVAIRMAKCPPAVIANTLGQQGIFTWHGNFYALNLTRRLGVEDRGGLLRIGLMHYNTLAEVNRLLTALTTMVTTMVTS
ncbi:cysteine desulfurase-like protein [Leptothoe spongobia]|uniref:cysteine desulfurase-like protein n=1 Tax=Leptothoe spongobia TaxID=2651728 RepID=UPI002DD68FC8|nr:cysteine desulfurase-like protein [Leptothoe spongobia]